MCTHKKKTILLVNSHGSIIPSILFCKHRIIVIAIALQEKTYNWIIAKRILGPVIFCQNISPIIVNYGRQKGPIVVQNQKIIFNQLEIAFLINIMTWFPIDETWSKRILLLILHVSLFKRTIWKWQNCQIPNTLFLKYE